MQTLKTSKAKENILRKIRTALNKEQVPMPYPEVEKAPLSQAIEKTGNLSPEETFAESFIQLGGKFVFCDNEQELLENISTLYENMEWQQMLCAEQRLLQIFQNNKLDIAQSADIPVESADACITGCEALVARTGSILLSSRQYMGRTSPVYYPAHIVVAYANQVVPDIKEGLELLKEKYKGNLPSLINLNSGPSRTADIEKTLVVGVHGPGEVFCFYVNA